jgi:hypothetical protein
VAVWALSAAVSLRWGRRRRWGTTTLVRPLTSSLGPSSAVFHPCYP